MIFIRKRSNLKQCEIILFSIKTNLQKACSFYFLEDLLNISRISVWCISLICTKYIYCLNCCTKLEHHKFWNSIPQVQWIYILLCLKNKPNVTISSPCKGTAFSWDVDHLKMKNLLASQPQLWWAFRCH